MFAESRFPCLGTGTKKYGTASGYCDGTGDYIKVASSVDFNIFGGDHAIEGWFYFDSVANTPHLIVVGTGTTNRNTLWVSGAKLRLTAVVSNTYYDHIIGTTTLTTGAFYHFAISRSGSTTRLFINGTLEGSTTSTAWFNGSSQELTIGFQPYGEASGDYFNGYFDDIRATKGSARGYTSNFTPPPAEFPDPT